jgi:hypothetical protein
MWDLFICHTSEDKDSFVRPLADSLKAKGLKVWYDEFELRLGDNLRRSIERGLSNSRFGAVVLSPNFFAKEWPQQELDGLFTREINSGKIILPIWHNVARSDVERYSPILANRIGATTKNGIEPVINEILRAIYPETQIQLIVPAKPDVISQITKPTEILTKRNSTPFRLDMEVNFRLRIRHVILVKMQTAWFGVNLFMSVDGKVVINQKVNLFFGFGGFEYPFEISNESVSGCVKLKGRGFGYGEILIGDHTLVTI